MLKKLAAIYSVLIGICVIGMWCMLILSGQITEGPVEISFHLFSEFLMAVLLIIGGSGLIKNKLFGQKVFLISNGMLIYSVLNAAGYYGQKSDLAMTGMFAAFFIISSILLILALVKKEEFN